MFEPIQLTSGTGASLALDKFYRLRVSSAALRELKLSAYQYVVISVDVENKRIGVAKMELAKVPNASALKIDKRGYLGVAIGKQVASKLGLSDGDLPVRFSDIGNVDESGVYWRAFELTK
jgi:ABC-type lipoprotein release transport system permease subunit